MTLDLLFNGILLFFFGFCFIDIGKVAHLPGSDPMGAAMWPQIILGLLIILLGINIYKIIKKNRAEPSSVVLFGLNTVTSFFKSKLFLGILLVLSMSLLLDPLGFIPTTFLFLMAYGYLLGQRKYLKLVLISLFITIILFFIFSKGLSIILPRGYGVLRDFALLLENI